MRIYLPSYLSARTAYSIVGQMLGESLEQRATQYSFDFTSLRAVEPAGVAAFSALIARARHHDAATCRILPGTCSPLEPAVQTLRCVEFFPRVLAHPVVFTSPPDPRWHPIVQVPCNEWTDAFHATLLPWIARLAGLSRFVIEGKLACLGDLFTSPPVQNRHDLFSLARVDTERGRLELALSCTLSDSPELPGPRETAAGLFSRLFTGLPADLAGWFTLHDGWDVHAAVPGGGRRIHSVYPAPVPYPGLLFDMVIDLATISRHFTLNEPYVAPAARPQPVLPLIG